MPQGVAKESFNFDSLGIHYIIQYLSWRYMRLNRAHQITSNGESTSRFAFVQELLVRLQWTLSYYSTLFLHMHGMYFLLLDLQFIIHTVVLL